MNWILILMVIIAMIVEFIKVISYQLHKKNYYVLISKSFDKQEPGFSWVNWLSLCLFFALLFTSVPIDAQVNLNSRAQVPLPTAFGEPGNIRVSSAVGAVSDRISIVVPPGRRGMQPQLSLSYSSMGGTGVAGLGWGIGTGHVERWRADGTPSLAAGDRYSYSLGGSGGELRDLDGDGVYRARIESVYRPFKKEGDGWGLFDGNGNYYSFGSSVSSRINGELWLLDRVEDPNGNTIMYTYSRECGTGLAAPCTDPDNYTKYLSEVRYTGHAPSGDPGANRVVFEYESRADQRVSYLRSVREAKNLRLKQISVWAGNSLVRRYRLDYGQYNEGPSLLKQVTLIGSDDISQVILRKLEFGERSPGWAHPITQTLPRDLIDGEGNTTGVQLMDINGDGRTDLTDNGETVYLGDGHGNFTISALWSASLASAGVHFVTDSGINTGVRLLDVNGDARPDIFIARAQTENEVYLNTGSGWQKNDAWSASLEGLSGLPVAYSDLDYNSSCLAPHCDTFEPDQQPAGCTPAHCIPEIPGDDDTPTVPANPAGCTIDGQNFIEVHCTESNAHSGFFDPDAENCIAEDHCAPPIIPDAPNSEEKFALVGESGESRGVELADLNGDGLVDIAWYFTFTGGQFLFETPRFVRTVFLNGGDNNPGWHVNNDLASKLAELPFPFVEDNTYRGYSFMDINGDGLSDIVRSVEDQQAVYLRIGNRWVEDPDYTQSMQNNEIFALSSDQKGTGIAPMDFNDDGLLDYVRADGDSFAAFVNTGKGWMPHTGMTQVLNDLDIAFVDSEGKGTGTTMSDIDGDGIGDLITASGQSNSQNRIVLSSTLRSGKLVRATGTLGEVTLIDWTSSTWFDNTTADGIQGLPFAMTVAERLSRSNGRGNTLVTEFTYTGGLFEDRGFRGFARVEQKPSLGLRSKTFFYQDEHRATRPMESSVYDSAGLLRARVTTVLVVVNDGNFIKQVQTVSTDNERFDQGGATHNRVEITYDDRLQVVMTFRDANVGPSGDESKAITTLARNDAAGIWSLPVRNRLLGSDGKILSETFTIYDGLPEGQALFGLLTELKELVEPNVYLSRLFEYDAFGNPVRLIDREGHETVYTYDAATTTFRTQSRDTLGRVKRSEYDPRFGTLVRDENSSGNATTTQYDAFGRISRVVAPGDETSTYGSRSFVYSPVGNPEEQFIHMMVTENAGTDNVFESTSFFDAWGNIYESNEEGSEDQIIVNLYEFDERGRPLAVSKPFFEGDTPVMATATRDEFGRPLQIVDPLGQSVSFTYKGLDVGFVDTRGITTSLSYTPDGDITEIRRVVDNAEQKTRYIYDVLGQLTKVVDALGNETRISYDALGRRTRLEDPNAGTFQYRYDGEGRLIEQIGPDGKSMRLRYSATGDLIEKELPDGTVHRFHYGGLDAPNATGELVEVEDVAGILELAYDPRGNIIERRRTVDGRTYVTGFNYDSLDRVRRVTYPDGFTVDYTYDTGGNIAAIKDGESQPLTDKFRYNAENRITKFTFGNGVTSDFSYDDLGRMISSSSATGRGVKLQELIYGFDAMNNVVALDDLVSGVSQQFTYDEANRLVYALGPYGEENYEYDAIGNLLRKGNLLFTHDDPLHPQRVSCAVEVGNKKRGKRNKSAIDPCAEAQSWIDPEQVSRAFALRYDMRGNVAAKGARSFLYDGENRLSEVREANGRLIEHNRYDASGELIVRETQNETRVFIDGIYEEGKTHVSRHVYAGPLLVATLVKSRADVVLISSVNSSPGPFMYTAGFSGPGILLLICLDGLFGWRVRRGFAGFARACRANPVNVAMVFMLLCNSSLPVHAFAEQDKGVGNDKTYYYHANHLGSVNVVTDDRARVTARRDYRPYGEPVDWSGAKAGPRELLNTFQGQKLDDQTGLYYFKARHYDAELGRFMNADTIVADINDPRTLHRYAFAGGNPVNYVDPTGRSFFSFIEDVGDFFTEAGEWIAENAEVITIVVVSGLLIGAGVFTGGTTTLLGLALLGGGVGFGIGAGIATALGFGVGDSEFWIAGGIGAGLGALGAVGFGGGSATAGFGTKALSFLGLNAKGTFVVAVAKGAFIGGVVGGAEGIIAGIASGSSVEETFYLFAEGAGIGAGIGAIAGGFKGIGNIGKLTKVFNSSFRFTGLAGSVARGIGTLVGKIKYLGYAFQAGTLVYAGVASGISGNPTKLDKQEFAQDAAQGLGSAFITVAGGFGSALSQRSSSSLATSPAIY